MDFKRQDILELLNEKDEKIPIRGNINSDHLKYDFHNGIYDCHRELVTEFVSNCRQDRNCGKNVNFEM